MRHSRFSVGSFAEKVLMLALSSFVLIALSVFCALAAFVLTPLPWVLLFALCLWLSYVVVSGCALHLRLKKRICRFRQCNHSTAVRQKRCGILLHGSDILAGVHCFISHFKSPYLLLTKGALK